MNIISRIKNKLWYELNPFFRERIILPYRRNRFNNPDVTILSSNCLGGCIAHDLNLRFNSPTVNLWMTPKDFIRFCSDLRTYTQSELQFIELEGFRGGGYPVAKLNDVTIYFQHYHTEEEARTKWRERCKRINFDNIRCIMSERDGCTEEELLSFSNLPFPTAAIVHAKQNNIPDCHVVRGFENEKEIGNIMVYRPDQYLGRKYYDDFDYVTFLNKR